MDRNPDGVGLAQDTQGNNWQIYQSNHDPNRFMLTQTIFTYDPQMLDNDGYVRFTLENLNKEVKIDIFNFAMEKVHSKNYNLNSYYGAFKMGWARYVREPCSKWGLLHTN
ncbi:hypothetical protein Ct9H90mP29_23180 [bacterium]|nr:MAG: hypothetical protein Ct9H90mP29_23180 [bacterium]